MTLFSSSFFCKFPRRAAAGNELLLSRDVARTFLEDWAPFNWQRDRDIPVCLPGDVIGPAKLPFKTFKLIYSVSQRLAQLATPPDIDRILQIEISHHLLPIHSRKSSFLPMPMSFVFFSSPRPDRFAGPFLTMCHFRERLVRSLFFGRNLIMFSSSARCY